MSATPYERLGLSASASQDEIKAAYRKRAKSLHPDLHPDDPGKLAEFQAVSAAYDLLGDAEKRRRFDAGEIDADGHERPEAQFHRRAAGHGTGPGGYSDADLSGVFSDLFGGRGRAGAGRQGFHARGQDLRFTLELDFLDAARGARRAVTLPGGKPIEITVPAGVQDGQTLRLAGKGAPGMGQGPAGDALISITVKPHPLFQRDGDDIEIDLPITLDEAVLGAKVQVPTIGGPVSMTIPKGASSGTRLRLKHKGITRAGRSGDQTVRLKIVLPKQMDPGLTELAERWRAASNFDPRAELMAGN